MSKNIIIHYELSSLHGTILHFYHFFYAVFVPLIIEYEKLSLQYDDVSFVIDQKLGPMLRLLLELPINIKLKQFMENYDELKIEKRFLSMMDIQPSFNGRDEMFLKKKWAKRFEYKHYQLLNMFMKRNIEHYGIITCPNTYNIVMVERKVHIGYSKLLVKHSHGELFNTNGSQRRSIPNHKELVETVKNIYPDKSLINISTEYLSVFYQYHLFNTCDILIAQHGAALAQISYMKPGSIVIEIVHKELIDTGENWFMPLAKACRIKHYQYITNDAHEVIDLKRFETFIKDKLSISSKH